jgi:1-deoxy-D-xylulose-5-phosphate synthase
VPAVPVAALPIGEAQLLSEGTDVLLVAAGRMVEIAEKAAVDIRTKGFSVGVVNARWVKPLDPRILEWAAPARHVVTIEDNVVAGGFGAAVMEAFAEAGQVKEITCIGIPDHFLPFGAPTDIAHSVGLDPDAVASRVVALLT